MDSSCGYFDFCDSGAYNVNAIINTKLYDQHDSLLYDRAL